MQTIRIALFSPRNKTLLSTIMALTQQPKYQYALIDSADIVATEIDIAVLNESDTIARAQLAVALKAKPSIQVLNLARDESQLQPARNLALSKQLFILHKHLMTDLLQSLDRLALTHAHWPAQPRRNHL